MDRELPMETPPTAGGKAETVMVIDDEAMLVELGRTTLRRLNYGVEGYRRSGGHAALPLRPNGDGSRRPG